MSIESATEKPDAQPRKSNSWSGVLTKLPVGAGVGVGIGALVGEGSKQTQLRSELQQVVLEVNELKKTFAPALFGL